MLAIQQSSLANSVISLLGWLWGEAGGDVMGSDADLWRVEDEQGETAD